MAAAKLRVVKYDEETGRADPFEVAQVERPSGRFRPINNYPADAQRASGRRRHGSDNLEIVARPATSQGEHEIYGVRDPDSKITTAGATGVGTRVTMKDSEDHVLADLIIGKEVKDQPKLRYVRKANRDRVYHRGGKDGQAVHQVRRLDRKGLAQTEKFDVERVVLDDYSTGRRQVAEGRIMIAQPAQRNRPAVRRRQGQVDARQLIEFKDDKELGRRVETDDQELNTEKLNGHENGVG